jgi:hypothetical protein
MPTNVSAHRTAIAAAAAFAGLTTVLAAIESLAVRGQLDFAQHIIHLTGSYRAAVPVALEAGGLTFAGLTLWATLHGEHAPTSRLMTAVAVLAASAASWLGSRAAGLPVAGALYLAGASILALVMWHQILHRLRRSQQHADGRAAAPPPPRPRFGTARWLIDTPGTWRAWKAAVLAGEPDAARALTLAATGRPVRGVSGETRAKVAAELARNPAISTADLATATGVRTPTLYKIPEVRKARGLAPLTS